MLVAAVSLPHWWTGTDSSRGSNDCRQRSIRAAEAKAVTGAIWLRVPLSETHAQYRSLEALAHLGEYVSSPRRISVLGCPRDIRRSIWMGRCPEGRNCGGVQTTHHFADTCSTGSSGGAGLGPHGTSDTGVTEHLRNTPRRRELCRWPCERAHTRFRGRTPPLRRASIKKLRQS